MSLTDLNGGFMRVARVVQRNRKLLKDMDTPIGLRKVEDLCLD